MDDFAEQIVVLTPTQFAELLGNLSDLVYDLYDRLKNGIIHVTRDVNVYITDDIEETIFRESEFDDMNTRTDYYDMFINPENIDDIPINVEPGLNNYHFTETITNQINTNEDILTARYMLCRVNTEFIINPQLRDTNNNYSIIDTIRRKMVHICANEIDEDRIMNQQAFREYDDEDDHPIYW